MPIALWYNCPGSFGMNSIRLRVPATTANLGPAFDCLGMALDIFNEISVAEAPARTITVLGEGAGRISLGEDNLVYRSMATVFRTVGKPMPALAITCHNRIPLARGLGSSAAAIASGLVAANELLGKPLTPDDLLQIGAELEGHADNIAPALRGGCQVAFQEAGKYFSAPIPLTPGLRAVLFIPDFAIPTAEARRVLPAQVPRSDAVFNLGRVALLTLALATGQGEYLRVATQDRLHQPPRQALFPAMESLFQAALGAGALGVFLSGSGSTILALTAGEAMAEAIGRGMQAAATKAGISGRVQAAMPSAQGAQAMATSP